MISAALCDLAACSAGDWRLAGDKRWPGAGPGQRLSPAIAVFTVYTQHSRQ